MEYTAVVLFFLCTIAAYSYSGDRDKADSIPTPEQVAKKLLDCGLITPDEKKKMLATYGHWLDSQYGIISALDIAVDGRYGCHSSNYIPLQSRPQAVRDEDQRLLHDYMQKLRQCGLLGPRIEKLLQGKIANGDIFDICELLTQAEYLTDYYRRLHVENLSAMMDSLRSTGLLTEASYQRMHNDLLSESIIDYSKLANYFTNVYQPQLPDSTTDTLADLEALYRQVAEHSRIPQLAFTDFRYTYLQGIPDTTAYTEEAPGIMSRYDTLIVQFHCNGRTYRNRCSWNYAIHFPTSRISLAVHTIHEIFNKVLSDIDVPLRLAAITHYLDQTSVWIVPVRKTDLEMINNSFGGFIHMGISPGNFGSVFATDNITEAITTYKNCGLFSHMSNTEIAATQQRIAEKTIGSFYDIVIEFPHVIFNFDYDSEKFPTMSCKRILTELAAISRGDFTPTDIVDESENVSTLEDAAFTCSFTFKGKRHTIKLAANNCDGNYMRLLDCVAQMTTEQMLPGRFYQIGEDEESYAMELVYLRPEQYECVKRQGLLAFPKQDEEYEEQ